MKNTLLFILTICSFSVFAQSQLGISYTRARATTGDYNENGITIDYNHQLKNGWFIGIENTWLVGYGDLLGLYFPNRNEGEDFWLVDERQKLPYDLQTPLGEGFSSQNGIILKTLPDQDLNILFPIWFGKQFLKNRKSQIELAAGLNMHYSDQRYNVGVFHGAIVDTGPFGRGPINTALPTMYYKRLLTMGFNARLEYNYSLTKILAVGTRGAFYHNINGDMFFAANIGLRFKLGEH